MSATMGASARSWSISPNGALEWSPGSPLLMAIVNVTPDSFSDGGENLDPARATDAALAAIDEGAAIVDVGGESTRPGAAPVAPEQQIRRVVPVIAAIRAALESSAANRSASGPRPAISVDTTSAEVAVAALDAGADIVNDTSAGADDPGMLPFVASRQCGLVLMHRAARPHAEAWSHEHRERASDAGSVVSRVRGALEERVDAAVRAGIARSFLAIDPGLGFGKSVAGNFELIARLEAIVSLGPPVLVGASRKSFIGAATGVESPRDRLAGSLAAAIVAARNGAAILRVHDVAAHRRALAVLARCRID